MLEVLCDGSSFDGKRRFNRLWPSLGGPILRSGNGSIDCVDPTIETGQRKGQASRPVPGGVADSPSIRRKGCLRFQRASSSPTGPRRWGDASLGAAQLCPNGLSGTLGSIQSIRHVVIAHLVDEGVVAVDEHRSYDRYMVTRYGKAVERGSACHPSAANHSATVAAAANERRSDSWHNYAKTPSRI
jgi:hypothetical protein